MTFLEPPHMLMKNQSVDTKIEFTIIALLASCKCIKLQYLSLLKKFLDKKWIHLFDINM